MYLDLSEAPPEVELEARAFSRVVEAPAAGAAGGSDRATHSDSGGRNGAPSGGGGGGGGTIERDEACRMFGVSSATWSRWQRIGRVPAGRWTRYGSGRTYHKVYPLDELRRLLPELARVEAA